MLHRGLFIFPKAKEVSGDFLMSCIIQTISVPSGGKVAELLEDMKRKGKNVSQTVCGILERHTTLYDDNIQLELERNQLKFRYAYVIQAAKTALYNINDGLEWELYFPPEGWDSQGMHSAENYGQASRVHFRKVTSAE